MKFNIRLLYLYLFSFVGLLIAVIGSVQIVDLGLKTYVFKVTDYPYFAEPVIQDGKTVISAEEQKRRYDAEQINQKKRQLSSSLSMIMIGFPLYLYHWKIIKKENDQS